MKKKLVLYFIMGYTIESYTEYMQVSSNQLNKLNSSDKTCLFLVQ